MNRIDEKLKKSTNGRAGSLLPFFTAGYPTRDTFCEMVIQADKLGAAVIEIGLPYSDSIADGPVIQSSYNHVLERGQSLADIFESIAELRPRLSCGLVAMGSYSLIQRFGRQSFLKRAAEVGFDGVLIPDMPVEESAQTRNETEQVGLHFIGLVAPTTQPARLTAIVQSSSGFVYQVAVAGTTGERTDLTSTLADQIARVREATTLPICVGFGVATPDHVREVCQVADGAIVGSAIVRRITSAIEQQADADRIVDTVSTYLASLIAALPQNTTG